MAENEESAIARFFSVGLKPFFLASGLWAAVAIALWLGMLNGEFVIPSRFDPLSWHIHEMVFGFILASVAGFMLTALPSWTGRKPVGRGVVATLFGLWALGRVVCFISAWLPAWLAGIADLAFPTALTWVAAREIIAARNRRSAPVLGPLLLFVMADLLMHLTAANVPLPPALGWHLAVVAPIVLISLVAGRIVPAFTRNWLAKRGVTPVPGPFGTPDGVALALLIAGLLAWAFAPALRLLGYWLILAGIANFWRLTRWRGAATRAEPLLLILHVAYGWLALGAAILGLALLVPTVPVSAAIHALTVGAIATMILAVMTRATLGHTAHALTAGPATVAIYLLVTAGAILRIAAAFATTSSMPLLLAAGVFWVSAFLLFSVVYGRMIFGFGARRLTRS